MTVKLAFNELPQFCNASGVPYSGGFLYWYAAGSTTPQNTYTDITGLVANSNPITLNSAGRPTNAIWLTAGSAYKLVLKDSSGNTIFTLDNVTGINDTSVSSSEWAAAVDSSGATMTPTYISATSFSVAGDQTAILQVGRRCKFTVTAGTVYGTISAAAFSVVTTVTVVLDSTQALDSGLSAFSYGILSATNSSVPAKQGNLSQHGTLNSQTSSTGVGNGADATDDTLFTYTMPANQMGANGNSVRVSTWGATANNGNTKTIKLWFAGGSLTLYSSTDANKNWRVDGLVTRIDSTHVSFTGTVLMSGVAVTTANSANLAVSDLSSNTSIIKITGASGSSAANDVVSYGMKTNFEA